MTRETIAALTREFILAGNDVTICEPGRYRRRVTLTTRRSLKSRPVRTYRGLI